MSSRTLVLGQTRHLPSRNHHHRSIRPGLTREIDTAAHGGLNKAADTHPGRMT
jgi:ABC-type iron transport system FetAB permease component